ncbi:MAG: hypothetical protein GY910_20045 [bacterium]|nr:hypothetical protein [Deltaproteobacteria bacterium]MCP4907275.1 hypothetical protein [bacterium]
METTNPSADHEGAPRHTGRRRATARTRTIGPLTIVLMPLLGCLMSTTANLAAPPEIETRAQRIAALEESIARDHRTLEDFVSEPRDEESEPLHEETGLREIAERISAETRRLEKLRSP